MCFKTLLSILIATILTTVFLIASSTGISLNSVKLIGIAWSSNSSSIGLHASRQGVRIDSESILDPFPLTNYQGKTKKLSPRKPQNDMVKAVEYFKKAANNEIQPLCTILEILVEE
ncbi:20393_t:CDS:2 [Dentiscutata erythropus]|uniref:20393_t:CDS:1 n=1 Tax=Dentiscutata erythropus TaxID=1348616 RepID=A0A9N9IRB7_9GLOM|nr:20393_t:CDS:2 [Dentiscutata erythropus]